MKKIVFLAFLLVSLIVAINLNAGQFVVDLITEAPEMLVESRNIAISSTTATLYITTSSYITGDIAKVVNPNTAYVILVGTSSIMNNIIDVVPFNYGSFTWLYDHGFMYLKYQAGASATTVYGNHSRKK